MPYAADVFIGKDQYRYINVKKPEIVHMNIFKMRNLYPFVASDILFKKKIPKVITTKLEIRSLKSKIMSKFWTKADLDSN